AGAWAACFGTTLLHVARSHGIEASAAVVTATVVFYANHDEGRYELSQGELRAHIPGADLDRVKAVLDATHEVCPVSKALRSGVADLRVEAAAEAETVEA